MSPCVAARKKGEKTYVDKVLGVSHFVTLRYFMSMAALLG